MSKFKVIMDSGKEYSVDTFLHHEDFVSSLYDNVKSPFGTPGRVMSNTFMYLDNDQKILINPTHVSSIEIID